MDSSLTIESIPPELLSQALAWMWPASRIFPLMRVCTFWRDVIIDHPKYWQDLYLFDSRPNSIDGFLLRMSRSYSRSITVVVQVFGSSPAICAAVLPAVASHMHHIERLNVTVHLEHAQAAFDVLSHAAPLLREASIGLNWNGGVAGRQVERSPAEVPQLPAAALYRAPALEDLGRFNVRLPDGPGPPWLASLQRLVIQYRDCSAPVPLVDVFSRLPSVYQFVVSRGAVLRGCQALQSAT